jgi:O-antigen/teichoic acid export membrane protein
VIRAEGRPSTDDASVLSSPTLTVRDVTLPRPDIRDPVATIEASTAPIGDPHQLLRGSFWVTAGYVAQAVTGALFWLFAARMHGSSTIGQAAALFASLQFVNYLTAMGLQEMIGRFHSRYVEERDRLVWWAVITTIVTSAIGTAAYLGLVSAHATDRLLEIGWWRACAVFAGLSAATAVSLLVDVVWMAHRRWRLVFVRLLIVGGLRIPLLALPIVDDPLWLFVVMAAPAAISGLVGLATLQRITDVRYRLRPMPSGLGAARYSVVNYVGHLSRWAPQFVLPVVVLVHVTPAENANFFLAWTIAAVLVVAPVTIGRVLLVESSRAAADTEAQSRMAALVALAVAVVAYAGALALEPAVVWVYGDAYSQAARALPMLVAAGIPWAFTSIALSRAQVLHDHLSVVLMPAALAVGVLGSALLLVPDQGVTGAVRAWLVGNLGAAVVAAVLLARSKRTRVPVPQAVPA